MNLAVYKGLTSIQLEFLWDELMKNQLPISVFLECIHHEGDGYWEFVAPGAEPTDAKPNMAVFLSELDEEFWECTSSLAVFVADPAFHKPEIRQNFKGHLAIRPMLEIDSAVFLMSERFVENIGRVREVDGVDRLLFRPGLDDPDVYVAHTHLSERVALDIESALAEGPPATVLALELDPSVINALLVAFVESSTAFRALWNSLLPRSEGL